jgi:hypothetical protein
MAEAEKPPEKKKDLLAGATPIKLNWGLDFDYRGNSAGEVLRIVPKLKISKFTVGAGGGVINFNYFKPQPYLLVNASFDTDVVSNVGNVYATTVMAFVPKTSMTVGQYFHEHKLGTSWDVLASRYQKAYLRIGAELSVKLADVGQGAGQVFGVSGPASGLDQMFGFAGLGLSFHYDPVTLYTIGRFSLDTPTAIQQNWTDLRPFASSLKAGVLAYNDNARFNGEFELSRFDETGRVGIAFASLTVPPELSIAYTKTFSLFGGGNAVTVSFSIPLGAGRARVTQESGGPSREAGSMNTVMPPDLADIAKWIANAGGQGLTDPNQIDALLKEYSAGKINEAQLFAKLAGFNYVGPVSPGSDGYMFTDKNGKPLEFFMSNQIPILVGMYQDAFGPQTGLFSSAMYGSATLKDFAAYFKNASFDDKIRAAAMMSALGLETYNSKLAAGSVFGGRQGVATLDPDTEFGIMKTNYMAGKQLPDGICANINGLAAEFLREAGVDAYLLGLGSGGGMHNIAAARDPASGKSGIVDYGSIYSTQGPGIWPVIQMYAATNGFNLLGVDVYGKGNKYLGYYEGPEGRLMETALGTNDDLLKRSMTRKAGKGKQ